jgi:hypothetical protein
VTSTPHHPSRARAHLALARLSNSPTVVSNALAGASLAGALSATRAPTALGALALLSAAMVLFYTAGMYLNDLFDLEHDRRVRPERPLPAGAVSRREALTATVLLFASGTFLLSLLGAAPLVSGLVLVALIVLYDAWHKTNPLSPLLMAATRAMVYVTAFLALRPTVPPDGMIARLILWALLLGLYVVGLTYIAKTETRTLTGYWPAALLFLPAAFAAPLLPWRLLWLPLAFALWLAYSLSLVYAPTRQVGRATAQLIAGVSLVDALVLGLFGTLGGVWAALIAFGGTLVLQRYIRGT